MSFHIERQIKAIWQILGLILLRLRLMTTTESTSDKLYKYAKQALGSDASPLDFVTDELGCAESVSNLIKKVMSFKIITGTWTLNDILKNDTRFVKAGENSGQGTIIICATATGNGKIRGHVGILGRGKIIMAANSRNGLWSENYTIETWYERYKKLGGFPVNFYRAI